jgi:hypothetical protein
MVTSHEIHESGMGNRVSKSISEFNELVKEQRVDGSCCPEIGQLRYTLMDLETSYQVNNPSNLTCNTKNKDGDTISYLDANNHTINPMFVTGFTDAEGSFMIKLAKAPSGLGWRVQLDFTIGLHLKDLVLVKAIQNYFGVGNVQANSFNNTCCFTVTSLYDILNIIIPHFDKFCLCTKKKADYLLFRKAALLMAQGLHLTIEGLNEIVSIRASINWGLTPGLSKAFSHTVGTSVPVVELPSELNPH